MNTLLAVATSPLALLVPALAWTQTLVKPDSSNHRHLERLTREWVAASQGGDAATLRRLLDDTFTFISPRGRLLPKTTYVANRTRGTATMDSLRSRVEDIDVRVYGNTAVVTSRLIASGRARDGDFGGDYRRRDVWVKRDRGWRAVSNQLAPINYTGAHPAGAAAIITVVPAGLEWTVSAHVADLRIATLHGTEYLGPYAVRVKRPPAHFDPPHHHESDEHVTVLSGALRLGAGERADETRVTTLQAGSYAVIPAGTPHYSWSEGETVYQSAWAGPAGPTYVAMATPAPATAPVSAQPRSAEQEVRSLEHQRRDAILLNDTATLNRLLGPTLTTVTAGGRIATKADELAVNRNVDRKVLAWEFEELDIRVYGDAAVSTIRTKFTDVLHGQERTEHQRLTHTWVIIAGRWQLVARHATRVVP